jgi:hypothetical protein
MQIDMNSTDLKPSRLNHSALKLIMVATVTGLLGCQIAPPKPTPRQSVHHPHPPIVVERPTVPYNPTTPQPEFGYPPLVSQSIPVLPIPPQPQVVLRDGHNIPLVQRLMVQGLQQLKLGQLDNAEESFVQVQRIAPQYSSVYARLSEVALKRKDGASAEVMARRGLVLARSPQQKLGFWQLIALAGAMQNKPNVVNEANGHLQGQ